MVTVTLLDKSSGYTVFVGLATTLRGAEVICRRVRVNSPVMRGTVDEIDVALGKPSGYYPSSFSYDIVKTKPDIWMVFEMFKGRRVCEYSGAHEHRALRYAVKHADDVPDGSGMVVVGGARVDIPLVIDDAGELVHETKGRLTIIRVHPRKP